jgi:ABC-2 type transport system permease protein
LRRNLAAGRVAILSQLEYRTNFLIDALIQPILTAAIEVVLWMSIISAMGGATLGGFGREYYLSYALWANFLGRVTSNWMYEFTMLDDIDSGRVNTILVRPISFYEFFLFQFMSYKLFVAAISFIFPIIVCKLAGGTMFLERLPLVILSVTYYLIFVHTLSFCVASCAFFINRASSFTMIKNIAMWTLAGELVPLDLFPEPIRTWMINAPFASGVYIPVGYLTGRFDSSVIMHSFISVTIGIVVAGALAAVLWRQGLKSYTGTGA